MHRPKSAARATQTAGTVQRVDTVNRELVVLVNGAPLTIDVPVGCATVLRGERVRLRVVQPRDRVRVAYTRRGRFLVALAIEVQPDEAR